jgi:hypothetical protein
VTSAIATAAATVTFVPPFSPLFACGVLDLLEPLPPAPLAVASPVARFASAFSFTVDFVGESSPDSGFESFFSFAPAELAFASVTFAEEPSALNETLPVAVRFRSSCESTRCSADTSASERPMPALPPFVAPLAFVVVEAVCVAWAVSAPVMVRSGPVPIDALVVTVENVSATCAESAKLPLPADAPPCAVVVILSVLVAVIVRSSAPLSAEPSGRPANVVSSRMFSAKEAPIPVVLPSADCFAVAIAWLSWFDVALSVRSPPTVTGSVPWMLEVEVAITTFTAIEPATPTLLPPAPDVVCDL